MSGIWRTQGMTSTALFLLVTGCGVGDKGHDQEEDRTGTAAHADAPSDEGGRSGQDMYDHPDGAIHLGDEVARRMGVTLVPVLREDLERAIRGTGEVIWDETRLSTVSLRFGGWAERLHVDFTGRFVAAGEPLLDVYSPELISAQEDLLAARRLSRELAGSRVPGTPQRGEAALQSARERLRFWQVPEREVRALEETGTVQSSTTLEAPFAGYVVEMNVQAGERFEAGAPLYRMADLSRVWLEVDVYERDLPFIHVGSSVEVEVAVEPGPSREGRVTYIYPEVDRQLRTARIRVELTNPAGRLKPGMFAIARTRVVVAEGAVTVPRDAVMHTGERALVFVALGEGAYEPRPVRTGAESGDRVEILSGLEPGERVVARAGFILDAESRLMEAMMGQPGMPGMEMDMEMDMEPGTEVDPGAEMDAGMEMDADSEPSPDSLHPGEPHA